MSLAPEPLEGAYECSKMAQFECNECNQHSILLQDGCVDKYSNLLQKWLCCDDHSSLLPNGCFNSHSSLLQHGTFNIDSSLPVLEQSCNRVSVKLYMTLFPYATPPPYQHVTFPYHAACCVYCREAAV